MELEVFIDGLCQPRNPKGIACYAFLIRQQGKTLHAESGQAAEPFSDDATNNVAEYTALLKSLDWLIANRYQNANIRVKSDSQLLVNQMRGEYRVRDSRIIPLFKQAAVLVKQFQKIVVEWLPREQNKEADAMTSRAYNQVIIERPDLLDKL